jgi:hypothetical protein
MGEGELKLFTQLLACADSYLEFGSGGSTCVATALVKHALISVEGDADWAGKVAAECARHTDWMQPQMHYVDIGPTGNWGMPTDPETRSRWPDYHGRIWEHTDAAAADLLFVDGRFRVACCAQVALHARSNATIVVHDYTSRVRYHVVEMFLRPIARADDLVVFKPRLDRDPQKVRELLAAYERNPN